MKFNKIVPLLILPLTVLLATTGCPRKSGNVKVTPMRPGVVAPAPSPNIDTKPINPIDAAPISTPGPTTTSYTNGPINTTATWDLANYNQDREKLAADTVHFKYDSTVVEDSEQSSVTAVADALKGDANARLLIEGHCDERGTEEYNRSLGERRALALREALAKIGVDADRIRTISYGKDKPVDPGHAEAAWAKNRRGEFIWCAPKNPAS